jgi:hypothetical protein
VKECQIKEAIHLRFLLLVVNLLLGLLSKELLLSESAEIRTWIGGTHSATSLVMKSPSAMTDGEGEKGCRATVAEVL